MSEAIGFLEELERTVRRATGHKGAVRFTAHPEDFKGTLCVEAAERNYRVDLDPSHPRHRIYCLPIY